MMLTRERVVFATRAGIAEPCSAPVWKKLSAISWNLGKMPPFFPADMFVMLGNATQTPLQWMV